MPSFSVSHKVVTFLQFLINFTLLRPSDFLFFLDTPRNVARVYIGMCRTFRPIYSNSAAPDPKTLENLCQFAQLGHG